MDILDQRVEDAVPPAWCERRGWVDFLLGLDMAEVERCEAEGLGARLSCQKGAPDSLVTLAAEVAAATRMPFLDVTAVSPSPDRFLAVSARKRAQLGSLLGALGPMAESATRIVDVGAGSGHFTRIAAELFERAALGIERDERRLAAFSARLDKHPLATGSGGSARLVGLDACRETLAFEAGDLAVGLHACGELGDRLVTAAGLARCDVALVSCCLQKIAGESRRPLSRAGQSLVLRRDILGLTNLTAEPQGVETTIGATIAARQARFGLLRLLRHRGVSVGPGEEMRGINRRRARLGLRAIAVQALAMRSLPPPTDDEIGRHEQEARDLYGVVRRLSLPRSMLSRLVEVAVVLDRAAFLQERGLAVQVATLFKHSVTPRNLAIFASQVQGRLPRGAA